MGGLGARRVSGHKGDSAATAEQAARKLLDAAVVGGAVGEALARWCASTSKTPRDAVLVVSAERDAGIFVCLVGVAVEIYTGTGDHFGVMLVMETCDAETAVTRAVPASAGKTMQYIRAQSKRPEILTTAVVCIAGRLITYTLGAEG